MPAGFNKGQIEYIKTIANVNGHKGYTPVNTGVSEKMTPITWQTTPLDRNIGYLFWTIGDRPLHYGPGSSTALAVDTNKEVHNVYNIPINQDQEAASFFARVTPECFLESVHTRFRLVQQMDVSEASGQHTEYRMVVFRHKEKQSHIQKLAQNFCDPAYDLFVGASRLKCGVKGYRNEMNDQGDIDYQAFTTYSANYDKNHLLTCMVNKEDYVVMKDCRFYLGKEYGGKHIFETSLHWDHQDPISTDSDDITEVDSSDKNYVWYVFLMGVNNELVATAATPQAPLPPYVELRSTTHHTSG